MKKKILLVIHSLNMGGAQISLINALDAFDYDNATVTLYVRSQHLQLVDRINKKVTVIVNEDTGHYDRFPVSLFYCGMAMICRSCGLKKKADTLMKRNTAYIVNRKFAYEKKRYFANQHYDIAISYTNGHYAKLVAEGISADKKILFNFSSTDDFKDFPALLRAFDTIVTDSDGSAKKMKEQYAAYADRVTVIANYVKANEIREKAESEQISDFRPVGVTFVTCGRMTKVKGYALALTAAKRLKDSGVAFQWLFVGDGPDRAAIEEQIKQLGLEKEIIVAGLQSNPYPFIKLADIYVQPSFEESYGLTISEAMILCKPVVSTKTVGGCEQIRDRENGILTDISGEALANGILTLLKDKATAERICQNLDTVDYSQMETTFRSKWNALLH